MLYHLFEWLKEQGYKFPGRALFEFITFRVLLAMLFALVISMLFGRKIIWYLRKKLVGESVRDLGLRNNQERNPNDGRYYHYSRHHYTYIIISQS